MRFVTAFRAFFRVLFDRTVAIQIEEILKGEAAPSAEKEKSSAVTSRQPERSKPPVRSDAIALLAALQREARFVDIVREPLSDYTDAQIGAAARDVLRDCGNVLERMFALRPLVEQEEGSEIEAPKGYDAGRYRLTGDIHGEPPFCGKLVHHGWTATRCEVPQWSGTEDSAQVVAPIELEVK